MDNIFLRDLVKNYSKESGYSPTNILWLTWPLSKAFFSKASRVTHWDAYGMHWDAVCYCPRPKSRFDFLFKGSMCNPGLTSQLAASSTEQRVWHSLSGTALPLPPKLLREQEMHGQMEETHCAVEPDCCTLPKNGQASFCRQKCLIHCMFTNLKEPRLH